MPHHSHPKRTQYIFLLGLFIPCLLISFPAFVAYRAQQELADSFRWVSHTLEVETELQRLRSLLLEAESNQRAFLLTTQAPYLEAHQRALKKLQSQIVKLRILTEDNPTQQENVRLLDPMVSAKLEFMARSISLEQRHGHEAAMSLINTAAGKQTMDAISSRLEFMEQEESRLLLRREQHLITRARFSTVLLSALVLLNLLFVIAILIILRKLTQVQTLVTICAWSRTVEYQGEWLSFEEYILRRFNLNTSHGISPAEAEKALGDISSKKEES